MFSLTLIALFSLILYLIRFNSNNKRHYLNYGDRKEFQIKKSHNLLNIVTFKELNEKSEYLKIAVI